MVTQHTDPELTFRNTHTYHKDRTFRSFVTRLELNIDGAVNFHAVRLAESCGEESGACLDGGETQTPESGAHGINNDSLHLKYKFFNLQRKFGDVLRLTSYWYFLGALDL